MILFNALVLLLLIVTFSLYRVREVKQFFPGGSALFDPAIFFSIIYFAFFVLESVAVYFDLSGSQWFVSSLSKEEVDGYQIVIGVFSIIAYGIFILGYNITPKQLSKKIPVFHVNSPRRISRNILILVYLMIGLIALSIFGWDNIIALAANEGNRMEVTSGLGYLFFLVFFYSTGLIILYSYTQLNGSIFGVLIWILPVPLIVFGRTDLLTVWLTFFMINSLLKGNVSYKKVFIYICIAISIVVMSRIYRVSPEEIDFNDIGLAVQVMINNFRHILVAYDNFISYLSMENHLFQDKDLWYSFRFSTYIFPFLSEYRADSAPQVVMQYIYEGKGGAPFTIVGLFHASAGILGILSGMFVLGVVVKIASDYLIIGRLEASTIILISTFNSRLYQLIGGSLTSTLLSYFQIFFQLILAFMILSFSRKFVFKSGKHLNSGG